MSTLWDAIQTGSTGTSAMIFDLCIAAAYLVTILAYAYLWEDIRP